MARQVIRLGIPFLLVTAALADVPVQPEAVRRLQSAFRQERGQAEAGGAARIFAPALLRRADDCARQGDAALAAGQLDDAARAFHDARWQLPALPPDFPANVARVLGNSRLRHGDKIEAVAFSPDGKRLATASDDGTVKLWDLANGHEVLTFRGHKDKVKAAAFSPDGSTIASAGGNRLLLWDPQTGHEKRSLQGHTGEISTLAFRPDGKMLASAGNDKSIRYWEPDSGRQKTPPDVQGAAITSIEIGRAHV